MEEEVVSSCSNPMICDDFGGDSGCDSGVETDSDIVGEINSESGRDFGPDSESSHDLGGDSDSDCRGHSGHESSEVAEGSDTEVMEQTEESDYDGDDYRGHHEVKHIDNVEDLWVIRFDLLSVKELKVLDFMDVEVAYEFYNQYNKIKGFGIRKHQTGYDNYKNMTWESFVCNRNVSKHEKHCNRIDRRRKERPSSRCGCVVHIRVHIELYSDRSYICAFNDDHNHELSN